MTSVRRARLVSLDLTTLPSCTVTHTPHSILPQPRHELRMCLTSAWVDAPSPSANADDAFGSETAAAAAVAIASLEKLRRVNVSFPIIPPSLYTKSESRNDNLCPCFDEVLFLRKIIYTCQGLNEGNSICADDGAFWNYRYSRLE